MKSHWNAAKNPEIRRIKWPYSIEETEYLQSIIYSWLKNLKDVGKWVNYEEFCISIINSIPETICAPEFINYWDYWYKKFRKKRNNEVRKKVFETCVTDLKEKWLLPSQVTWLTGDFNSLIMNIIEKSPTI